MRRTSTTAGTARAAPNGRAFSGGASDRNGQLLALLVGAAILLGGASAPASWAGFAFQVVAGLLLLAGLVRFRPGHAPLPRVLVMLALGMIGLVLVHLAPLPPGLWTTLPGREIVEQSLALAEVRLPFLPLSLDPGASVVASLALMPVAALGVLVAGAERVPVIPVSVTVVGLGLVSWIVGVLQALGARDSALYFHAVTNRGSAVGFFANANHLATLLVICVPVATALAADRVSRRSLPRAYCPAILIASAGLAALGITLTGSVAGIVLLPLAALASLFLMPGSAKARLLAFVAGVGVGFAAVAFSVGVLGTSFAEGSLSRQGIWQTSLVGLRDFWPVGSGLGTFPVAYRLFEDPAAVTSTFVNHAHNDYLEILFEAGVPGALLIAAVIAWYGVGTFQAWRAPAEGTRIWQRAASIVVGLVLLHSAVDYPLRTPAILMIVLFFAVVLSSSVGPTKPIAREAQRRAAGDR